MARSRTDEMEETEMEHEWENGEPSDVFEMLKSDHRKVQELFTRFEDADKRGRASIAEEVLTELEIHTKVEEELVYPAIRKVIEEVEMVDEAKEEHHIATLLIKELHKMNPGDDAFATKFKVLGELVGHHIEEEEGELFPKAEEGELDTGKLSEQVLKRKEKLMQKHESGGKKGHKRRKAA